MIAATITFDLGLRVEATIAVDGAEIGLVTLARVAEGGLPLATGSSRASPDVATWVAGQPDSRRAVWAIEQAVAEALDDGKLIAEYHEQLSRTPDTDRRKPGDDAALVRVSDALVGRGWRWTLNGWKPPAPEPLECR